jgi:hypothetical protein
MELDATKNIIRKNIIWEPVNCKTRGQSCSLPPIHCILYSPDLDIRFHVGCFSSAFKNKEYAMVLFEITLDECII